MRESDYVRHKETGEVFEVQCVSSERHTVLDAKREVRIFENTVLLPHYPDGEWEDLTEGDDDILIENGHLEVRVPCTGYSWRPVPSSYTRYLERDGKLVIQRRKA